MTRRNHVRLAHVYRVGVDRGFSRGAVTIVAPKQREIVTHGGPEVPPSARMRRQKSDQIGNTKNPGRPEYLWPGVVSAMNVAIDFEDSSHQARAQFETRSIACCTSADFSVTVNRIAHRDTRRSYSRADFAADKSDRAARSRD